jgi:chromosome partitioning protein
VRTLALFNNKGGVGKTSLTYHLAWAFAQQGRRVLVVDLDPQANLTSLFLDDDRLEALWPEGEHPETVLGAISPILEGTGDVRAPHLEPIEDSDGRISLVAGDLGLGHFEAKLAESWPRTLDRHVDALRVTTALYRMTRLAAEAHAADVVFVDVGPNLGSLNRAALLAVGHVLVPLVPDLFSMQGLRNLGPTLRTWRAEWAARVALFPATKVALPHAPMLPAGYIVQQLALRRGTASPRAYARWSARIPSEYARHVLGETADTTAEMPADPACLARLKHYRSLMLMAMEARKPIFALRSADGALGAHLAAVRDCEADFVRLVRQIENRILEDV